MASMARFMIARHMNGTSGSLSLNQALMDTNGHGNKTATLRLINSLVFAESKSIRTSTIILAVFNVLASLATAGSILYDCYLASKRCNPKFKASKFCVSSLHPAETFPLVLAIGIAIQGIAFAGVQGQGLHSLSTHGCSEIAQFMWPALMIVPYIQVVFGLECAIRSLRKRPFQARRKYDVTVCCGVIILMLIITWIPSHIFPENDFCLASLLWFISDYGKAGLIILSSVAGLLLISTITIFTRLSTVNLIDEHQRIAASRMVYYLVLGFVSLAFVIPYFISQTIGAGDMKASMMATVVLNLSGLMSGLLHLFLRSNTATTSFGPRSGRHWDRSQHQIRIWGPNELAFTNHLVDPVFGPQTPRAEMSSRADSRASLVALEKGRVISMESLQSPFSSPVKNNSKESNTVEQKPIMPSFPKSMAELPSPCRTHSRKQSYSLFPPEMKCPAKPAEATSNPADQTEDIGDLVPPPAIFGGGPRHGRNSSIISSATVQIGLRLSHGPTPSMRDVSTMPLPQTTYAALPSTTFNANDPKSTTSVPTSLFNTFAQQAATPLKPETDSPKQESPVLSPYRPSPLNINAKLPVQSPVLASINKTLPPTPKAALGIQRTSNTQLSPAVYSPEKKAGPVATPQLAPSPMRNDVQADGIVRSNSNRIRKPTDDWI